MEEEGETLEKTVYDTTPPPTDTMLVTAEVSADLAVMESLLDSVTKTPTPASNRKVLRSVLTTQDNQRHTTTQGGKSKVEEDMESLVMLVDPQEEIDGKKLADQLNAFRDSGLWHGHHGEHGQHEHGHAGSQGVEFGEDAGVRGCRQMSPAP